MVNFRSVGPYDVVICDIDGCLSPESHEPIDVWRLSSLAEYNKLAVEKRDRPIVTLCSGRPIAFVECLCRLIHNTLIPCIGENGVWIWRPFDNSFESDPAITAEHREMLHEARGLIEAVYGNQGVIQQPGKTSSIALYHPDTAFLRSQLPAIEEMFQDRGWPIRVSMTWLYINCDFKHVSKATAIERLMSQAAIDPKRTAGIGDTMGDKFIADRVAWFGCPANAESEIKKSANHVSEHDEVEGVMDLLERLVHRSDSRSG